MKKKLVVLDFDKTLIEFDSFRLFALQWMKKQPIIAALITMRILRIINAATFKKKVIQSVQKNKGLDAFLKTFTDYLSGAVCKTVLEKALSGRDADHEVLILSASPQLYMELVGKKLNTMAQGSYFDERSNFIHLHGNEKLNFLQKHYPPDQFEYTYAVSDSESDLGLLMKFKTYDLIKKK